MPGIVLFVCSCVRSLSGGGYDYKERGSSGSNSWETLASRRISPFRACGPRCCCGCDGAINSSRSGMEREVPPDDACGGGGGSGGDGGACFVSCDLRSIDVSRGLGISRPVLALLVVVLARARVGRPSRLGFPATVKVEYT